LTRTESGNLYCKPTHNIYNQGLPRRYGEFFYLSSRKAFSDCRESVIGHCKHGSSSLKRKSYRRIKMTLILIT
jgi:hypothetical protein